MTAVARLIVNNYPLIIGDILLSGPENPDQAIHVPSIGNIDQVFPKGSGFKPSGLSQKLSIIDDNLIIGWSGSWITANTVMADLYQRNSEDPFTNDTLMQYFQNLDKNYWKQGLSLVGFIKDHRGIAQFGFNYHTLSTELFGQVGLLGSGVKHFEKFLNNFPTLPPSSRETNALESSIAMGLIISGVFLSGEISTYDSLLTYFGGGYEIASLFNGKFKKFDDATFLFWHGEISSDGIKLNFHQVSKNFYLNDILLIKTGRLYDLNYNHLTMEQDIDVVLPIYRSVSPKELDSAISPSFNYGTRY